jgi:glyoxylase-like metal-dependent hydrolase (beta-lactamase superfamily II)
VTAPAPGSGEEIVPGVHRVELPLGARRNSVYLFAGTEAVLLFDTGMTGDAERYLCPYLQRIGRHVRELRYAVVSHGDVDHWGGNADLKRLAPHVVLACHRAEQRLVESAEVVIEERYDEFGPEHGISEGADFRAWVRQVAGAVPVDLLLCGGESVHLGDGWVVEILHVPGHSRGHLAIHDPRSDALVVSDAVLADSVNLADGSPAFPPTYRYVETYRATCRRLAAMDAEYLLTAHYPTMRAADAAAFLATSLAYTDRVEQALLRHLAAADAPVTTRQLVAALTPWLGAWPAGNADVPLAQPLVGHLEHLVATGRVRRIAGAGAGPVRWAAAT